MKKIFIILLISLSLTSCLPEKKKQVDSDFIRVVIADRIFKVPKGYLDGKPAYGRDNEALVLRYSLPGFKVLPRRAYKKERLRLLNAGRMRGMLLENASSKPSFDIVVDNFFRSGRFKKTDELLYGLENYIHEPIVPKSPHPGHKIRRSDDFLIEYNHDGKVKSFIRCSPPNKDTIPGCSHHFRDKGLKYKIRWAKRELPHWEEQRKVAISFIDNMEHKKEKEK